MAEPRHPAEGIAEVMDAAGLASALIGGLAVNTWVVPRFTADIDLVVVLAQRGAIAGAEAALLGTGFEYVRRQDLGEPSGPDFIRMQEPSTRAAVDLQVAKTAFQARIVARARIDPSGMVRVATPEDLIVLKLIANRSKDQKDLAELVQLPGIDWDYVEREAAPWGVAERLRALRQLFDAHELAPVLP